MFQLRNQLIQSPNSHQILFHRILKCKAGCLLLVIIESIHQVRNVYKSLTCIIPFLLFSKVVLSQTYLLNNFWGAKGFDIYLVHCSMHLENMIVQIMINFQRQLWKPLINSAFDPRLSTLEKWVFKCLSCLIVSMGVSQILLWYKRQ